MYSKLYLICFLPQKVQNGVGNEVMGVEYVIDIAV